jgi:hypothetical protein
MNSRGDFGIDGKTERDCKGCGLDKAVQDRVQQRILVSMIMVL